MREIRWDLSAAARMLSVAWSAQPPAYMARTKSTAAQRCEMGIIAVLSLCSGIVAVCRCMVKGRGHLSSRETR
jgi:hypothetical protein